MRRCPLVVKVLFVLMSGFALAGGDCGDDDGLIIEIDDRVLLDQ